MRKKVPSARGGRPMEPLPKTSDGTRREVGRTSILPCSRCPLRQLSAFRAFEPKELEFIKSFKIGEMHFEPGSTILRDGESSSHLFTILKGWAIRYKLLPSGRRQVLNFSLAGDLLGIQASLFRELDHSIDALTEIRLCVFPRQRIWELYQEHPGLAHDLTWIAAREESILASHLANVGQRPAAGRLAYVAIYLFDRARRAGLVSGNKVAVTITQNDLADALGLSPVHTNKTLMLLRKRGWLTWSRQEFVIDDEVNLRALAGSELRDNPPRPFL